MNSQPVALNDGWEAERIDGGTWDTVTGICGGFGALGLVGGVEKAVLKLGRAPLGCCGCCCCAL